MHETADELAALQKLIGRSCERAGSHLRAIHAEDRRLSAESVVDILRGVCVLNLATVSKQGRPIVAPVDGLFLGGVFWFGSSQKSLRFAHIRNNP